MSEYWLFLDDERMPAAKAPEMAFGDMVIVRSYDQFVEAITSRGHLPSFITFDHDLGGEKTGMDCAHWLTNWVMDDPSRWDENFVFDVHSQNSVGLVNIVKLLNPFIAHMNKDSA